VIVALVIASGAAGAPRMLVGVAEDAPKQPDLVTAVAKIDLARLAGFNALRLTQLWTPGRTRPSDYELERFRNAVDAASLRGVEVFLAVYPTGSRSTPRTQKARNAFAGFTRTLAQELPGVTHFIIGNEPNLNRFWMPQFTRNGGNASAPGYVALLAQTYDTLKAVSPEIKVIGGAVSPRGGDDPHSKRHTQSPTRFIPAMGKAYRRMHRKKPIMDAFALHPYPISAKEPPTRRHKGTTVGIADYDKLVTLLGRAFDRTAQPGTWLPIYYPEFGVQSKIPKRKERLYANRRAPAARDAVSERVQGAYYRQALAVASCQPTVAGVLFFKVADENDLKRWQSGIYYADETPKSSLPIVRNAIAALHAGRLGRCPVQVTPETDSVTRQPPPPPPPPHEGTGQER
jgi:hypothetical protein